MQKVFDGLDSFRSRRVLLAGWEQFDEPVDRIVSIGAFEHFGYDRYDDFFAMAYSALPDDGVMLLHTITVLNQQQVEIQSEEVYERYMRYLTGCERLFERGYFDLNQFTLAK